MPQWPVRGLWIGAALLVLAGVGWLFYDESLQPQAQTWLDAVQTRSQGSSAAYELLMGLDAPLAQDPRELGRQRLAEYAVRRCRYSRKPCEAGAAAADPDFDVLCALGAVACFDHCQADPKQALRELARQGSELCYSGPLEDTRGLRCITPARCQPRSSLLRPGAQLSSQTSRAQCQMVSQLSSPSSPVAASQYTTVPSSSMQ
jgi:hypothetical protein